VTATFKCESKCGVDRECTRIIKCGSHVLLWFLYIFFIWQYFLWFSPLPVTDLENLFIFSPKRFHHDKWSMPFDQCKCPNVRSEQPRMFEAIQPRTRTRIGRPRGHPPRALMGTTNKNYGSLKLQFYGLVPCKLIWWFIFSSLIKYIQSTIKMTLAMVVFPFDEQFINCGSSCIIQWTSTLFEFAPIFGRRLPTAGTVSTAMTPGRGEAFPQWRSDLVTN